MADYSILFQDQLKKLHKAIQHLAFSYKKVLELSCDIDHLDDESLEVWESFAARFSRVADIFLMRVLRTYVLIQDPGFTGSLRDFINQGEKYGVVDNAEVWLAIRELRNRSVHDYSEQDLAIFYKKIRDECPRLLKLMDLLHAP